MLDVVVHLTDPPAPRIPTLAVRSLADRDEYGPITGLAGGVFTAPAAPLALLERDDLGHRLAGWVPDEHLL
jgi:hypothetical protein